MYEHIFAAMALVITFMALVGLVSDFDDDYNSVS